MPRAFRRGQIGLNNTAIIEAYLMAGVSISCQGVLFKTGIRAGDTEYKLKLEHYVRLASDDTRALESLHLRLYMYMHAFDLRIAIG